MSKLKRNRFVQGAAAGGCAVLASDHVGAAASNCDTVIAAIISIFTGGC